HLAFRGNELAATTAALLDSAPLPSPGECSVAGVAGDELAVHRPQGSELVPYTLWGEIAFQIGARHFTEPLARTRPRRQRRGRPISIPSSRVARRSSCLTSLPNTLPDWRRPGPMGPSSLPLSCCRCMAMRGSMAAL